VRKLKGLTRIDVAVALACIAFILAEASILNAGGRERSKRELCLANLRMLTAAWQTYSNDNSGKVPVGDVYYSWAFPSPPLSTGPQRAWREWPHPFPHSMPPTYTTNYSAAYPMGSSITQAAWEHATAEGTMWKYVGDYNIYRCPDSDKNAYVSYSMSQSMNTDSRAVPIGTPRVTLINQIIKPDERFVFLDTGVAKRGAFYVRYNDNSSSNHRWADLPPMRHEQGTTFVFADGHAIYRKWTDPHAIEATKHAWDGQGWANADDKCDCDLRWMTKITWGNVPYYCNNPDKQCEY
jgi:prepilin-type processing-associated H-X9-DG protein